MFANYHTHTPRCHHATGAEEEYVRCAVDAGMQILGFSDHTPYPFADGFRSSFRMDIHELADYTAKVLALRKQYAAQIAIGLGVEAEFYPKYFREMVSILQDHGMEYMILGQHFLYNETENIGSGGPTADSKLLEQYCNQTIDAMHTGLFSCFAHPDLMCFVGEDAIYRQQIRRLCKAAKECGIPLELNLLGLYLGRSYPDRRFWEIAAEENCSVILGCDAHRPDFLLDTKLQQQGLALLESLGLQPLQTLNLRPVKL